MPTTQRTNYYGDTLPGPSSTVYYKDSIGFFTFVGAQRPSERHHSSRLYGMSEAYVKTQVDQGRGVLVKIKD